MVDGSAGEQGRWLRTAFALGQVGGMGDAQLVERFVSGVGTVREDAFAALVHRHGPMVLGVCRRMLPRPGDADDAFQAVFLVLARKAGAVRDRDSLRPWLHGVALRVARDARRRSARLRVRESHPLDDTHEAAARDPAMTDLLALLDEELARLPLRLRDPLLLCELEGTSRREAALRLGLPEGTLSSRLARGRTLLRDRLARRGVSLGAGPLVGLGRLPTPVASFVDSTVKLALIFATRGVPPGIVPAALSSLATGVIGMSIASCLKLALAGSLALGSIAGLAWAVGPARGGQKPEIKTDDKNTAISAQPDRKGPPDWQTHIRGIVVDEGGQPVPGVAVSTYPHTALESKTVSNTDGSFTLPFQRHAHQDLTLLARPLVGEARGFAHLDPPPRKTEAEPPARVVMKSSRAIVVRVADGGGKPILDASVEATSDFAILDATKTGANGTARLIVPADANVEWIAALKPGAGLDYAIYGEVDEQGHTGGGLPSGEIPDLVTLTLEEPRTVRIKAVDVAGWPLAGVKFVPWLLRKPGHRGELNISGGIFEATTGPDGVVTFDWLPTTDETIFFWPRSARFPQRRVVIEPGLDAITATLIPAETIRGRVAYPDGSPAVGFRVWAIGSGYGWDDGFAQAFTEADGTYVLNVAAGEGYAVSVDDPDWAARSRLDVIIRAGRPASGVDFPLGRGTLIRGRIGTGPDDEPGRGIDLTLTERSDIGLMAPFGHGEPDGFHRIERTIPALSDERGEYSVRVGPGTYTMLNPEMRITVTDEAEIVRDVLLPQPAKRR